MFLSQLFTVPYHLILSSSSTNLNKRSNFGPVPQNLLLSAAFFNFGYFFQVRFTTTLFALIRENLKINVRESSEMDQADIELRTTIIKCWPHTKREKIELLVPTWKRKAPFDMKHFLCLKFSILFCIFTYIGQAELIFNTRLDNSDTYILILFSSRKR